MFKHRWRVLLGLLVPVSIVLIQPGATEAHRSGCHRWHSCPSDTGSYVCGDLGYDAECPGGSGVYQPDERFRVYWNQHGGLPVFGYGKTPLDLESDFPFQIFERARLESHPENDPPYHVQLARVGEERLLQLGRDWQQEPKAPPQPSCRFFAETGHNLCEPFLTYWRAHGLEFDERPGTSEAESIALFGYPLTEATQEVREGGVTRLTQWFERARFEYFPENAEPYKVQLGLLGNEVYAAELAAIPPSPSQGSTPATPSGTVDVLTHSAYYAHDIWWIVGEVQNNTTANVGWSEVNAHVYAADGTSQGSFPGWPEMDVLVPGQRSPFKIVVPLREEHVARYDVRVDWYSTQEQPVNGLTIAQDRVEDGDAQPRSIVGEVRNDTGQPVKFVNVVATLYNEQGTVVQTAYDYPTETGEALHSGQTRTFNIRIDPWNSAVRYEVQVQGMRP